jgi:hypothetical protein
MPETTEAGCALCRKAIAAGQNVVIQTDGQVAHVTCLAATWKPLSRLIPEPKPDPTCEACSQPIRPTQSIIKNGNAVLHVDCYLAKRRPIVGGAPLPAWRLIGDEQIGRRFGTTPTGHREFVAACAEARLIVRRVSAAIRTARLERRRARTARIATFVPPTVLE